MVNNFSLKVIITYKDRLNKKSKNGKEISWIEFGVAYNDKTKNKKVHKGVAYCEGVLADFVYKRLRVKDVVLINGFLSSREINCVDTMILVVANLEPLKTKIFAEYTDVCVDNSVFDRYLKGFDKDEKEVM